MLGPPSFRPYRATRFAFDKRKHSSSARHAPRENHLLAALSQKVYERLLSHLEPFPLPLGWAVDDAGDQERHLYFRTEGIVFRVLCNGRRGVGGIRSHWQRGRNRRRGVLGGRERAKPGGGAECGLQLSLDGGSAEARVRARRPAAALAPAIHHGPDQPDGTDRGMQSLPFGRPAIVPVTIAVPGSLGVVRNVHDAATDHQHAWCAARRRCRTCPEVAASGVDSLPPRCHHRARPAGPGDAVLRVLRVGHDPIRSSAFLRRQVALRASSVGTMIRSSKHSFATVRNIANTVPMRCSRPPEDCRRRVRTLAGPL